MLFAEFTPPPAPSFRTVLNGGIPKLEELSA